MAIPTSITDLDTNEAMNSPAGSDNVGGTLDNFLRAHAMIIRRQFSKGANVNSASTTNLPPDCSFLSVVKVVSTINAFSNAFDGRIIYIKFEGGITLAHSASLVMPAGVDVVTEDGDVAVFVNESSGVWRCVSYPRYTDAGHPGAVEPTITWPFMTWADTGDMLLKRRNAANTEWVVERGLFGAPTSQLGGFRNKILNGRFTVNQKSAPSRTASNNTYNYDQWYYDGTYLYQPIPAEDVADGVYTLSWEGGSTAAWSLNSAGASAQGGQSYTAVGNGEQIIVSGHTNQHLWVRFQGDLTNLDKVQLEPGAMATPFEERPYALELFMCQYFLPVIHSYGAATTWASGLCTDAAQAAGSITFNLQAHPRRPPTGLALSFALSNLAVVNGGGSSTSTNSLTFLNANSNLVVARVTWSGGGIALSDPILLVTGPATGRILFTGCQI